jgi:hypothetical protein
MLNKSKILDLKGSKIHEIKKNCTFAFDFYKRFLFRETTQSTHILLIHV